MLPINKRRVFIPPAPVPPIVPHGLQKIVGGVTDNHLHVSSLFVIRRELMDADCKLYIGPNTFMEDAHIVNCGEPGLPFRGDRCKYVFQAKGCMHSCEWHHDRATADVISKHEAYDDTGNPVDFCCMYSISWVRTDTRRKQALGLPGHR